VPKECQPHFHGRKVWACACWTRDRRHGTGVHRCYAPLWVFNSLPHRVARQELVGLSASQSCLVGVGGTNRLAQLLDGSWFVRPLRSVSRQELVRLYALLICSAGVGRFHSRGFLPGWATTSNGPTLGTLFLGTCQQPRSL
jgi:hypothetical protein